MGCGLSKAHSNPEVLVSRGSARLPVHGRRLIVQRHHAGWLQAHIAAAMGVSRKCVRTWIERFVKEGEAGLLTRFSRPHAMPARTAPEVEERWSVPRGLSIGTAQMFSDQGRCFASCRDADLGSEAPKCDCGARLTPGPGN